MKQVLLGLLLCVSPCFANSVIELQGYMNGAVACSDTDAAAATCTAKGGSMNDLTAAYTSGAMNLSGSGLVYSLNGSLQVGQGIFARSNPMSAFSVMLPVADSSGNWVISGSATSSESSRYALNIFANGTPVGMIGNGSDSFLVHHTPGTALTFTFADNVASFFSNDVENLQVSLTFTDPPADIPADTPEPASFALIATSVGLLFGVRGWGRRELGW